MLTRFIAAILFFLVLPAQAAGLDAVIQNLKNTYRHADSWQADFTQSTYVELLGREITKNGEMFLKKPGKLKIVYKGAHAKMYLSNGRRLWIYTEGDSQAELYPNASAVLSREALGFLQGLGELEKTFWVTEPKGSSPMKDASLELVSLKPRDTSSSIKKIVLGVEAKTGIVRETVLTNVSGNKTHYVFKNVRLNSTLENSFFEFKKPAGVLEIRG